MHNEIINAEPFSSADSVPSPLRNSLGLTTGTIEAGVHKYRGRTSENKLHGDYSFDINM